MKEKFFLDKAYFLYFIILSILVVFRILSSLGVFSFLGETADYVFTFIIQVVVLLGLSVWGFAKLTKRKKNDVLNEYKYIKISKKAVFLSILMGIIVYFLNSYIASFFYMLLSLFGYSNTNVVQVPSSYSISFLTINIFFTAVLPAICEETVHRGMLLSQIKKQGVLKAIVISSLLFGLLHINIYQFFYASILGVFLAVITLASDSIYPAMIVHFMNNALNVYLVFASVNELLSVKLINGLFALSSGGNFLSLLFGLLFLVFLLLCLYILYLELCKEGAKKKIANMNEGLGNFLARKVFFDELKNMKNNLPLENNQVIDFQIIKQYFEKNSEKTAKNDKFSNKTYSKILLIGCFALSVVTTIFTFIWGII